MHGIQIRSDSWSTYDSQDRMTARMDGDFVVFLIGMRINKPLAVHKYLPVLNAMPKMLTELGGFKDEVQQR